MTANTKNAIVAILATDPSVTEEQRQAALKALSEQPVEVGPVMRTKDVQAMLGGVTTKTLRAWTKAGRLVAVFGADKCRIGYTEASVRALAAGRCNKTSN